MSGGRNQHLRLVGQHPADELWTQLCEEARKAHLRAPGLAALFCGTIVEQPSLETALAHRIAARLRNDVVSRQDIVRAFHRAICANPEFGRQLRSDLWAAHARDFHQDLLAIFLYSNQLHARQMGRLVAWLSQAGETDLALFLQCCAADIFRIDSDQFEEPPLPMAGKGAYDRRSPIRSGVRPGPL